MGLDWSEPKADTERGDRADRDFTLWGERSMGRRILLVDDTEDNRDMLARRLARRGYEVAQANDGAQALAAVREQHPDLILMDMQMPVLDGYAATGQLKADPTTAGIPVIGLTAYAMAGDRNKVLAAGCDDYEAKPIDLPALLIKMARLLGEPEIAD